MTPYEATRELIYALRDSIPNLERKHLLVFEQLIKNVTQFETDMRDLLLKVKEEERTAV